MMQLMSERLRRIIRLLYSDI